MDADIAKEIGVTEPLVPLCCKWTRSTFRYNPNSKKVTLSIAGQGKSCFITLNNVRTVKNLDLTEQRWDVTGLINRFPHLKQADLSAVKHGTPTIFIGQTHAGIIV